MSAAKIVGIMQVFCKALRSMNGNTDYYSFLDIANFMNKNKSAKSNGK